MRARFGMPSPPRRVRVRERVGDVKPAVARHIGVLLVGQVVAQHPLTRGEHNCVEQAVYTGTAIERVLGCFHCCDVIAAKQNHDQLVSISVRPRRGCRAHAHFVEIDVVQRTQEWPHVRQSVFARTVDQHHCDVTEHVRST